jgi:hypothetical protein
MKRLLNRIIKFSTLWTIAIVMLLLLSTVFVNAQTRSAAPDNGLATLRVYNVAISVPDIDQTVQWYEDKLGFKLQNRRKVSTGIEIALIEKNDFYIDIIRIATARILKALQKIHQIIWRYRDSETLCFGSMI